MKVFKENKTLDSNIADFLLSCEVLCHLHCSVVICFISFCFILFKLKIK